MNKFNWMVLDVSHWQDQIDWSKVAKYASGVIIKSSEGDSWIDPFVHRNIVGAHKAGLGVGTYHYYHTSANPIEQAKLAWAVISEHVKLGQHELKHFIDVEMEANGKPTISVNDVITYQAAFDTISGGCTGIYSRGGYIGLMSDEKALKTENTAWWLASYNEYYGDNLYHINNNTLPPSGSAYTLEWIGKPALWQFTSVGRIDGVKGNVDVNYVNDWNKLWW